MISYNLIQNQNYIFNSKLFNPKIKSIRSYCLSQNSDLLAISSIDCLIQIWNYPTLTLINQYQLHQSQVQTISFTPNDENLCLILADNRIIFINVKIFEIVKIIISDKPIKGYMFLKGDLIYCTTNGINQVELIRNNSDISYCDLDLEQKSIKLINKQFYMKCSNKSIILKQFNRTKPIWIINLHKNLQNQLILQTNSQQISTQCIIYTNNSLWLFNLQTKRLIRHYKLQSNFIFIAAQDEMICILLKSNNIYILQASTFKCLDILSGEGRPLININTISPPLLIARDGKSIILPLRGEIIQLFS